MLNIRRGAAAALATFGLVLPITTAALPAQGAAVKVRATFASPRTDGLSKVTGYLTVRQQDAGTIVVYGKVSGLPAWSAFVSVPYVGPGCIPVPGVTAFPSQPFVTDATGSARVWAQVNPKAINPVGSFTAAQTGSVSIRSVIFPARTVPGSTLGTPTLPNVAAVEACDSAPRRIS